MGRNPTQDYIPGKLLHLEELQRNKWYVFMVDISGFPLTQGLSKEDAQNYIDRIQGAA